MISPVKIAIAFAVMLLGPIWIGGSMAFPKSYGSSTGLYNLLQILLFMVLFILGVALRYWWGKS